MSLNNYKNEVNEFLKYLGTKAISIDTKVTWLERELDLLKKAIETSNDEKIIHQLYDMFFLLFEITAEKNYDLDREWVKGFKRKQQKYLKS